MWRIADLLIRHPVVNAAMLAGQLDIISNLQAPDTISQFADPSRFKTIEGTTNGEVVSGLNNASAPLKDVRVRQAIAQAIDKRALVDTVWNGKGQVIGSMVVPTDPYYEDLTGINAYNPDHAKQLLAQAGYPNGLTLRLKPAALPYAPKSAQVIARQPKEVGITAPHEELQFPTPWTDVVYTKADYDMSIVAHVEARDLSTYANPNYYWRYNNPEFTQLEYYWAYADYLTVMEMTEEMVAWICDQVLGTRLVKFNGHAIDFNPP